MPRTLSLEEFDAPYGQPMPPPRTLTLEEFETREAAPAFPRRKPESSRFADAAGVNASADKSQPRTLALEEFDALDDEILPEAPSALDTFYEGAIKAPARNLYAGYLQSGGGLYDLAANALDVYGRLGATNRQGKRAYRDAIENLRGYAQQMYGESLKYADDNTLAKVYQGLGAAPEMIAELVTGTRLVRSAPVAFAGIEALHAADQEPKDVAIAAARGALMGKGLEAVAPLTRPLRTGAMATMGGASAVTPEGDVSDVVASGTTLGILGAMGGPGQVRLRDLRQRPADAPRIEPTLPRTATPAATEAAPGRPVERVEPFEPRTLTVEQFDAQEASPAQPKPRQRPIRRKPLSLAEFVATEGGMRDETGELRAMDAHLWHRSKPYRSRLVRDDGIPPEDMRLKAQEAGYIAEGTITGDFYELLRQDLSETGQKVYSQADLGEVEARRAQAASVIDRAELEHYADRLDIPQEAMARLDDNALANAITNEQAARGVSEEPAPQGTQTVIPGAERTTGKEFVEAQADRRIKGTKAQKPADEGLFDVAGRGQMEMPEVPFSGLTPTLPRFAQATSIERPPGRYAGSINLDRLDTPEAIKRAIGFVSKQQGAFKEARRGKISWQETEALAADLGMTVKNLRTRRRGQAFNAEQIEAARTLHLASAENLHLLAKKATESGAYEDVLAFDKAYHQHIAIQAEIEGSATEAGRALQIHRKLARAARGEKAEYIKDIIQSTGGRASMEELMEHIASLDAEGVGRYVQKAKRSTKMEKLREAWYMALLSDVTTQGVNIGSNAVVSLWTVPEHAVSGVIGKMHGGEKVYLREVFGRVYGIMQGAKTGLRMAYNAFESEVPSDLLSKVETQRMKAIPSVRFRKGKEKKRIGPVRVPLTGEIEIGGKQLRIPGRALLAGDEFFKAIGYSQKIHELAIRDGMQKGKRGVDMLRHVQQIKRNIPEGMHNQARQAARLQTFTEPLGKAGQAAMNLRERMGMPGWIVAPFMRTPVNIFKFTMKRTPAPLLFSKGEVREQIRAGGAERDIALGRIAFGSGIMTLIASYAASGLITGAGPDDPGEKAILRTTGWQPYSFKVGDEYYSYFYYEPLGSLFGMAADFAEIRAKYPEIAREEEWDRLASMIVGSMTNNLTNKTYLRGLSEAIRAVDDPSMAGERWIRGLSGTLIPTGIAGTARRGDPVLRDARSILDNFKSRIPGLRETLPPRLDPFGQEIRNEGALGPDIASRIYRSKQRPDKVADEMLRLKVTPGRPRRTLGGVRLGPEQYVEFVQLWRQGAKKELDILVDAPGWGDIPDFEQRRMIRNAFSAWRDMAEDIMLTRYPELLRKQTRQRLEAVTQ